MSYSTKSVSSKSRGLSSHRFIIIAVVILLVGFISVGTYVYKQNHKKTMVAVKVKPKSTSEKVSKSATPATSKQSGSTNTTAAGGTAPATVNVTKPSGSFVSNHKPGQNNTPLEEGSVCNTSPGASCTITFVKDGVTKALEAKVADGSGTAYWSSWTPRGIGLTSGNWTVSAVASSGQNTETTQDPLTLEII